MARSRGPVIQNPKSKIQNPKWLCVVALLVLASAGCAASQPLLSGVRLTRPLISPDGSGRTSATELHYALGRPARVNLALESPAGERVLLRRDEPRPVSGSYVFRFDGSYELPDDSAQRRVIADGQYRLVLEARDAAGQADQAAAEVQVQGADTAAPQIERLQAQPALLTPNFDARDDVAYVGYRLSKAATAAHYVADERGAKVWIGPSQWRAAGEYSESWNALVRGRPVPNGTYQFVVRAEDEAGNVSVARTPIQVALAGLPQARILSVSFGPHKLMLGELLRVEVRVRNVGEVTLHTQGPDPGYTYSSYDNYFSIEDRALVDKAGRWRVGVDWAGSPGSIGGKYPYRWGFGKDLEPGEEATVVGFIRLQHEDQRARFGDNPDYHKTWFFAALVQEGVAVHQDRVGGTEIQVSF
ncbi:MAG: hypothetical protein HY690_15110 [Chloroflexi bacterium]|nr:hypothetical protein [Chloroflexota bacterium]